jgi:hypothetical protein
MGTRGAGHQQKTPGAPHTRQACRRGCMAPGRHITEHAASDQTSLADPAGLYDSVIVGTANHI